MTDWRHLSPIPEADRPEWPARFSQTLLAKHAACQRSAFLYLKHHGGVGSHAMMRGTAIHRVFERAVRLMVAEGEGTVPPEIVKGIAAEVLAAPDLTLTAKEADEVRVAAYHFAEGYAIDPLAVVGVEQKFVLDLAGFRVVGKVDLASIVGDGRVGKLEDFKSALHRSTKEELVGSVQLPLYGVLFAFGQPVAATPDGEVLLPPVGQHVHEVELREVYPRLEFREDGMQASDPVRFTRADLMDQRDYFEGLVRKLAHSLGTGEWPAVPGSHCNQCPARWECPIPERLRDMHGSEEPDELLADRHRFAKREADVAWRELRERVKQAGGPVPYGADEELVLEVQESAGISDVDDLLLAVERAVRYGEPLNIEDFRTVRRSNRLKKRKRVESDPGPLEGSVEAGVALSASDRFGDEAPF